MTETIGIATPAGPMSRIAAIRALREVGISFDAARNAVDSGSAKVESAQHCIDALRAVGVEAHVSIGVRAGQVYQLPNGKRVTVARQHERDPRLWHIDGDHNAYNIARAVDGAGWRLVSDDAPSSIDTPAGRVTVGERWEQIGATSTHPFRVVRVDDAYVYADYFGDGSFTYATPIAARSFGGELAMRKIEPRPYANVADLAKTASAAAFGLGDAARRMHEEATRKAEEDARRALLGSNPFDTSPGTYSNMYTGRPLTVETIRKVIESLSKPPAPKPDPRAAREQRRREIDAVLREDARQHPAFARARQAAVMAACESIADYDGPVVGTVSAMLGWLREYEDKRGGMREPSDAANFHARVTFGTDAQGAYERARVL